MTGYGLTFGNSLLKSIGITGFRRRDWRYPVS
jgi:hypothetical protein